jgi:rod shape determining protein RodA
MAKAIEIQSNLSVTQKFLHLNWGLILLIILTSSIGFTALYSAAGGSWSPWASQQVIRFFVGFFAMIFISLIHVRWWQQFAYPCYVIGIVMLITVQVIGHTGMGAQRWIDLGFMKLQPSELMKVAVIMALARYFHGVEIQQVRKLTFLIPPALMVLLPMGLVLMQPDLGTALMIGMAGAALFLVAGAPLWLFGLGSALLIAAVPLAFKFILHDYQKQRILTFMNPEADPLGAGYHIMQSKIAIGSGGIKGKGFLEGTQSHLNFLPEKQTDFIFTLWVEEWGLIGGLVILFLMGAIFLYCGWLAFRCKHGFGRLLTFGLMVNFSLYCFINIAMVMGLIPVVGAPLPLISYGGTAMLAVLGSFGLIMSCSIHKDAKLPRI